MKFPLLMSVMLFTACSSTPTNIKTTKNPIIEKIEVTSDLIRPGDLKFIKIPKDKNLTFSCRGKDQKISHFEDFSLAIVVESYFSKFTPFHCELRKNGVVTNQYNFKVVDKKFPEETLRVSPKTVTLSKENQDRVWREQQVLNKVYENSNSSLYSRKSFLKPLQSKITSIYGVRRLYNRQKKGQHLGTDFRAAIGVEIPSSNRGRVVISRDLFYTGHTVIIDHGLDIFTVYGHLSKTLVKEGDIVEKGDIVGLSGNTGRSSGPHLHWGIKIQGEYIDGLSLVDQSEKIFSHK